MFADRWNTHTHYRLLCFSNDTTKNVSPEHEIESKKRVRFFSFLWHTHSNIHTYFPFVVKHGTNGYVGNWRSCWSKLQHGLLVALRAKQGWCHGVKLCGWWTWRKSAGRIRPFAIVMANILLLEHVAVFFCVMSPFFPIKCYYHKPLFKSFFLSAFQTSKLCSANLKALKCRFLKKFYLFLIVDFVMICLFVCLS